MSGASVAGVNTLVTRPASLCRRDAAAVADGDAGSLLAAVLQGEQAEERDLGDAVAVRGGDAEHAALLVR